MTSGGIDTLKKYYPMENSAEKNWQEYLKKELPKVSEILKTYGYLLDPDQPHVKGERFLMKALTTIGGQKLILLGKKSDTNEKVVIKITADPKGKKELFHERECRQLLHEINFAYDIFHSPEELLFTTTDNYLLTIHKFIKQEKPFLERPISEQFDFALDSFKAQEKARATTHKHFKQIAKTFGNRTRHDYLRLSDTFESALKNKNASQKTLESIKQAKQKLIQKTMRIEQYCGFLTHTDFVPHNFRISGQTLYLLDFSSLRFGNKHESWARFLNFMTLYNRDLETALLEYMKNNRAEEELESLHLMRLFRLEEIITYYTNLLSDSEGDLLKLNTLRVNFWSEVLSAELTGKRVSNEIVENYKIARDNLRSQEEKERQSGLH